MFERLLINVRALASRVMYALTVREQAPPDPAPVAPTNLQYRHDSPTAPDGGESAPAPQPTDNTPFRRTAPKIRRNDPCPCGSGKKYKQCHGKL